MKHYPLTLAVTKHQMNVCPHWDLTSLYFALESNYFKCVQAKNTSTLLECVNFLSFWTLGLDLTALTNAIVSWVPGQICPWKAQHETWTWSAPRRVVKRMLISQTLHLYLLKRWLTLSLFAPQHFTWSTFHQRTVWLKGRGRVG